jgi:hypothetical protein
LAKGEPVLYGTDWRLARINRKRLSRNWARMLGVRPFNPIEARRAEKNEMNQQRQHKQEDEQRD